jgi:hypothetical protein
MEMDKELVRRKLRGYAELNKWELQEGRERLRDLGVEWGIRQFLSLWRLARQLAPDAERVFEEQNIAHRVEVRARFRRIAERTQDGATG